MTSGVTESQAASVERKPFASKNIRLGSKVATRGGTISAFTAHTFNAIVCTREYKLDVVQYMNTPVEIFMVIGMIRSDIARMPARILVEPDARDMPSAPSSDSRRVVTPAVTGNIIYGSAAPRS